MQVPTCFQIVWVFRCMPLSNMRESGCVVTPLSNQSTCNVPARPLLNTTDWRSSLEILGMTSCTTTRCGARTSYQAPPVKLPYGRNLLPPSRRILPESTFNLINCTAPEVSPYATLTFETAKTRAKDVASRLGSRDPIRYAIN